MSSKKYDLYDELEEIDCRLLCGVDLLSVVQENLEGDQAPAERYCTSILAIYHYMQSIHNDVVRAVNFMTEERRAGRHAM